MKERGWVLPHRTRVTVYGTLVLVADYGLDGPDPPAWMVELLEDIVSRHVNRPRKWVQGENELASVLLEIQDELYPLGVDDYGEGLSWPLPAFGV